MGPLGSQGTAQTVILADPQGIGPANGPISEEGKRPSPVILWKLDIYVTRKVIWMRGSPMMTLTLPLRSQPAKPRVLMAPSMGTVKQNCLWSLKCRAWSGAKSSPRGPTRC